MRTIGNLASPFCRRDLTGGDAGKFTGHHLPTVEDPLGLVPVEITRT